jgi:hypothetical protein
VSDEELQSLQDRLSSAKRVFVLEEDCENPEEENVD